MKKWISFILVFVFMLISFRSVVFAEERYGHVYCRSASNTKKIALTFDDGPHPRYTAEILEILSEYDIKATFFIIGINAERYPEALQKIVDSGCEIGNHTYSHTRMTRLSEEEMKRQVMQCEAVFTKKQVCALAYSVPPKA